MTDNELLDALRNARLFVGCQGGDLAVCAIREAIERLTPKPPPEGSVLVRIAVAINSDGEWAAFGGDSWDDEQSGIEARGNVPDDCNVALRIVKAYVPVPEATFIPGVVEEAND